MTANSNVYRGSDYPVCSCIADLAEKSTIDQVQKIVPNSQLVTRGNREVVIWYTYTLNTVMITHLNVTP